MNKKDSSEADRIGSEEKQKRSRKQRRKKCKYIFRSSHPLSITIQIHFLFDNMEVKSYVRVGGGRLSCLESLPWSREFAKSSLSRLENSRRKRARKHTPSVTLNFSPYNVARWNYKSAKLAFGQLSNESFIQISPTHIR